MLIVGDFVMLYKGPISAWNIGEPESNAIRQQKMYFQLKIFIA